MRNLTSKIINYFNFASLCMVYGPLLGAHIVAANKPKRQEQEGPLMFDIDKANKKTKSEKSLQSSVFDYAKTVGVFGAKCSFANFRGVADGLFIYQGRLMFMEFKRARVGVSSALQKQFRRTMRRFGVSVHFVYSPEQGKELIREFIASVPKV